MVEHETAAPGWNDDEGDSPRSQESSPTGSGRAVYLNNAGQARLSDAAKRAGVHALLASSSPALPHADADQKRVRELFATLIGAAQSDVCIHPSTAFAITMAAENIFRRHVEDRSGATRKDDATAPGRIVVLEDQMCSAVYGWQDIVRRSKGSLVLDIVPFPSSDAESWTDLILERLDGHHVAACCLPPLHWSDGSLVDLVRVGEACRARSVPLIVDSTQASGILECDVRLVQPALMACSVHKWLRSCPGAALVYVHPSVHDEWQPLDQHGRGRDLGSPTYDASKDEMSKDGYPTAFFKDARKFDAGGKPNPVILPILRAALEEVVSLNIEEAQEQLRALMSPFLEWASRHGYVLPSSHAYHLVGIRPTQQMSPEEMIAIAARLESAHSVYVAVRCGAFRISPYLDTTPTDMDRLVQALAQETMQL